MGQILITCILVLFIVGGCINSLENKENTSTQQIQTIQTKQERQEKLNKINNLIKLSQQSGVIKGFNEYIVGNEKCMDVVVDEYIWNQLPHETKQQMCFMFQEYTELTGIKVPAFKGYRTGKTIMAFASTVHNF